MFCVYCGKEIEETCTKCKVTFQKKKTFTLSTTRSVETKVPYCAHCGGVVYVIRDELPKEISGICEVCGKPSRINKQDTGDMVLV